METVLVVAPHPDDEVLGVGGTILRHVSEGDVVHIVICTRGDLAHFGETQVTRVQSEARDVHAFLEVAGSHFLDLPAARLDTIPGADLHAALQKVFDALKPTIVYLPHIGDVHRDHQLIFQAAMVCCRPNGQPVPHRVLTYETVSETDWYAAPVTPAFVPSVYIDISRHIDKKLQACSLYTSQIRPAPSQRSLEAIRAQSITRGHAVNMAHAEAFCLVREVVPPLP